MIGNLRPHLHAKPISRDEVFCRAICGGCGHMSTFTAPRKGVVEWVSGVLIQDALPDMDAPTRELLISGMCGSCWENLL